MNIDELIAYQYITELPVKLLTDSEHKQSFKTTFQAIAADIYADIESLTLNGANCSCAKKVREHTANNKVKVAETIYNYFQTQDKSLEEFIKNVQSSMNPPSLSGKILKTTVAKWQEFSAEISKYTFRSFSVVKDGDDLYVYFL